MKIGKVVSIMLMLCLLLSACGMVEDRHTDYFGFDVADFILVEEEDTHGGFLGDGSYYLILDCSQNAGQARIFISSKRKSLGGLQKTFAILSFLGYNGEKGRFAL